MALDSRTKTMIVASITAAAMVVTSLVIWKQVFFGKRQAPETAVVAQRPEQPTPDALAPQAATPGQPAAQSGGAIMMPVAPRETPGQAAGPAPAQGPAQGPALKDGEKTLEQIFSEHQPAPPQGAPQPAPPQPSSGPDLSPESGQRLPVTANAKAPAEPNPGEPEYRPVEADSAAAAKTEMKTEPASDDPERAALESALEKEALGLTKKGKEKTKEKKSEPAATDKKTESLPAAKPEPQAPAAKAEPSAKTEPRAKAASGSAWKGRGVFQTASVSASGNASTVRIKATAVPPAPVVVTMDSPARVIVDLPGHWEHEGPGEVAGAGIIRKVRIGKHADKLRIVLDLSIDATSKLSGKPVIEETSGGLSITVKE